MVGVFLAGNGRREGGERRRSVRCGGWYDEREHRYLPSVAASMSQLASSSAGLGLMSVKEI